MSKPVQKAPQAVFNSLPIYQTVKASEIDNQNIFHCGLVNGCAVFFIAGPGSILIEIDCRTLTGLTHKVELYGGKNSWTKNELDKQAITFYNEMFAFLVSAHSWVFSFAG